MTIAARFGSDKDCSRDDELNYLSVSPSLQARVFTQHLHVPMYVARQALMS